ncbi:dihydrofolate reductase [Micromonospora zingiberis]|uniref:Dihydrofolate reductase n=1 Tax=Micromonospora zingiberis TaxID=2053011 RepID=A0A4R0GLV5_9ACTN|nr:dihydrofolate reductase family protein [Micromonospora zingiberis]TCB96451.1 dihydrofolate reductase [Micromonospora zingiberis]
MRKLVYYVASTIDGFIAAPDGSYEFLDPHPDVAKHLATHWPQTFPTVAHEQLGIDRPQGRFDTVLMGHGTYQPALDLGVTSPYAHLRQYVFARSLPPSDDPAVEIVSGDPVAFVRDLKARPGGDIWLCGGGHLAGQLFSEVDELVVKLNPIVVGSGIPLVEQTFDPQHLTLLDATPIGGGVIIVRYTR